MSDTPRFGCPHCGGEDIREANVAFTWLRIDGWNEDGTPESFDVDEDHPEWTSDEDVDAPLTCWSCEEEFDWGDVVRIEEASHA